MENLISYMNKELDEVFNEIEEEVEHMVKTFYDPEVASNAEKKKALEIAKSMKLKEMDTELIVELTGLTQKEVEEV